MKAQIFTLDALIAVAITVLLMNSLQPSQVHVISSNIEATQLQSLAIDELAVMKKTGVIKDIMIDNDEDAQADLQDFLQQTMPNGFAAQAQNMNYKYIQSGNCGSCNANGSAPVNGFCFCSSVNASIGTLSNSTVAVSKRMDIVNQKKNNQLLSVTTIKVSRG